MRDKTRTLRCAYAATTLCSLGLAACGSGTTDPGGRSTLTISPTTTSLRHPGDTVRLALGGSAASGSATWATSDPSVLSVSGGLVEATGYGFASVTARVGEAQATATVAVLGETSMAFLEGTWTTDDELTPDDVVGGGKLFVVKDQGALRAVWRGTLDDVPVEVVSLLVPRGSVWSLARADGVRGTYAVMDGTVSPGRIELDSGTRLGGGWRERSVFTDLTSSSVRWTVEESEDGGTTWTPRWVQLLHKAAAQAAPAVLETLSPACTGGVSLNMYDPRSERWGELYVASAGGVIEIYGGVKGGAMVLEGTTGTVLDRVSWSTLEDGRVRQLWEESTSGGPLSTVFDGYYKRR